MNIPLKKLLIGCWVNKDFHFSEYFTICQTVKIERLWVNIFPSSRFFSNFSPSTVDCLLMGQQIWTFWKPQLIIAMTLNNKTLKCFKGLFENRLIGDGMKFGPLKHWEKTCYWMLPKATKNSSLSSSCSCSSVSLTLLLLASLVFQNLNQHCQIFSDIDSCEIQFQDVGRWFGFLWKLANLKLGHILID